MGNHSKPQYNENMKKIFGIDNNAGNATSKDQLTMNGILNEKKTFSNASTITNTNFTTPKISTINNIHYVRYGINSTINKSCVDGNCSWNSTICTSGTVKGCPPNSVSITSYHYSGGK